tara:strand:- start:410 stop:553 length:144 start_codon:yes stop_codon:yes gene_type:complete
MHSNVLYCRIEKTKQDYTIFSADELKIKMGDGQGSKQKTLSKATSHA